MTDRDFIRFLITVVFSNAKDPHLATLYNTFVNRLNDIADKLEKQEKALEIIKKKYVHIPQLLCAFENQLEESNPLETYYNGQVGINVPMPLTEEEFDLLKEVFWNEN